MAPKEKRGFSFSTLLGNNSNSSSKQHKRDVSFSSVAPPSSRDSSLVKLERPPSRPMSVLPASQPSAPEVHPDVEPELQPVVSYLSAHSQKLYTEGYFLKLTDLNPDGKPNPDREWVECFGQLVGTILSLWDAAALDAVGPNAEVTPTYLNLTDAQIKMIDTLPTRSAEAAPLKNVLSISTAGKNRFLFHFNSHHSLTQWTAGIRLAMYELATLQEAYTGALIAGKGKTLGCIQEILERTKFRYEDWVRVRFGAGEPWQKCWAVITPPDEKEYQKQKKALKKQSKNSGNPPLPVLKGDIKFYPTKKIKRVTPIATVTNAYACYAIYPQARALIEQSTLVKLEGTIKAHSPDTLREGFVFIMPELHPAVSGFETLLRWLFPSFDVFMLYGRPGRLVADTMDTKSLMFGMPRDKNYGYLEVSDVASLIVSKGDSLKSEEGWRKELKELTLQKMTNDLRKAVRSSLPPQHKLPAVHFEDNRSSSTSSSPVISLLSQHSQVNTVPTQYSSSHKRSVSEAQGYLNHQRSPQGLQSQPGVGNWASDSTNHGDFSRRSGMGETETLEDDESDLFQTPINHAARQQLQLLDPPQDIPLTPSMAHHPSAKPIHPLPSPPLDVRHQARMSTHTLDTLMKSSPQLSYGKDYFGQHSDSPRASRESNLFDNLPSRPSQAGTAPPSPRVLHHHHTRPDSHGSNAPSAYNGYAPNPSHPLPAPPPAPFPHSQISLQETLELTTPIDAPPGYEPQSSHIVLAGPLPRGDRKTESEDDRLQGSSPPVPEHRYLDSQVMPTQSRDLSVPELEDYRRFSWEPGTEQASHAKHRPADTLNGAQPLPGMYDFPSSPILPKQPPNSTNSPNIPSLQTDFNRRPIAQHLDSSDTIESAGSIGSLANHIINYEALEKVGPRRVDSASENANSPLSDEDTLDRKEAAKMMRRLADSDSEYDDNTIDDYASESEPEAPQPPPRIEGPRTGVMKVVGQKRPEDVVIGDAHYKYASGPSVKLARDQTLEIPKIDFGKTINHGRSLSAATIDTKAVRKNSAQVTDGGVHIHSQQASPNDAQMRRSSHYGMESNLGPGGHSRSASGGTEKQREFYSRQNSSESGKAGESSGSQGSDSDAQAGRRRSMMWQPGMVQPLSAKTTSRTETPEQTVHAQAVAASQEHLAKTPRHIHTKKSSGNILRSTTPTHGAVMPRNHSTEAIPRPPSRGGNAAFLGTGLVSAPDLHSHLSAREQEFVARYTRTPLLGDAGKKKPPHQAGLLGAIETREREKREMKGSWAKGNQLIGTNPAVQQALAQRQHIRSPSSRAVGAESLPRAAGQHIQQGFYNQLPNRQPSPQGFYVPQQQGGYSQQLQYQQQQQFQPQQGYGQFFGNAGR